MGRSRLVTLPRKTCYLNTTVASQFVLPKEAICRRSARKELVAAVAERYQTGTATEKGCILDEFAALTGYHRKHAIRVLN